MRSNRLFAKRKCTERYREQCPVKVAAYLEAINDIPTHKIVYIDEMGMDTFLHREYVYTKKGHKVIGHIPGKKYKRTGVVAAKVIKDIISPLQYDGGMDSLLFEFWFENYLMQDLPTDMTLVMDNASFHRKSKLIPIAKEYGHNIIFLPPYTPELNMIEYFWAWLKAKMRKVLHDYDSFDEALCYCFNVV